MTAFTLIYFDLRVRTEGFDLAAQPEIRRFNRTCRGGSSSPSDKRAPHHRARPWQLRYSDTRWGRPLYPLHFPHYRRRAFLQLHSALIDRMRSSLVVCLLALLSLTTLSAAGQSFYLKQGGSTITVDEYWKQIGNTQQSMIELEAKPEAETRQQLNALASQWELITAVELSDHSIVPINSTYLATQLRNNPPDLKSLEKSLGALLQAHQEFPQKVFTQKDVDPLKQILARPEFQWNGGQAVQLPTWLGNLLDAISKFLDRLTFFLANLVYQGRILLMIGAAILLLLVLFFISRNLSRKNLVQDAQLAASDSEAEGILSSKGAIQRARTLSMQGDYRNAIRYLYFPPCWCSMSREFCAMIAHGPIENICAAFHHIPNWQIHYGM